MKINKMTVVLLILAVGVHLYLVASQAQDLELKEIMRFEQGAKGYVSDELWYVSAARNLLRRVFGLTPKLHGATRATLVYTTWRAASAAKDVARNYGVHIICDAFTNITALYVEAPNASSLVAFAEATRAVDVVFGWVIGDAEGINEYLNLEHPPLAKYLIGLTMVLAGDRPLFWRIPSMIMGALTVVMTFLIALRLWGSEDVALVAAAATAVDPLLRTMASLAMLDIHVTALSMVAIYATLCGRLTWAIIAVAVASTIKFTALLSAFPIALLILWTACRNEGGVKGGLAVLSRVALKAIPIIIATQLVAALPLIAKLGFTTWLQRGVIEAVAWHLSAKCVGPRCPISSTPWEWFFGLNPFPIYLYPDGRVLYATGFVPAYAAAFVLAIVATPSLIYGARIAPAWMQFAGLFAAYVILWVAGARTQYSFYAVHLTPLIYTYLAIQLHDYLFREGWKLLAESWKRSLSLIWRHLKRGSNR